MYFVNSILCFENADRINNQVDKAESERFSKTALAQKDKSKIESKRGGADQSLLLAHVFAWSTARFAINKTDGYLGGQCLFNTI